VQSPAGSFAFTLRRCPVLTAAPMLICPGQNTEPFHTLHFLGFPDEGPAAHQMRLRPVLGAAQLQPQGHLGRTLSCAAAVVRYHIHAPPSPQYPPPTPARAQMGRAWKEGRSFEVAQSEGSWATSATLRRGARQTRVVRTKPQAFRARKGGGGGTKVAGRSIFLAPAKRFGDRSVPLELVRTTAEEATSRLADSTSRRVQGVVDLLRGGFCWGSRSRGRVFSRA